MSGEKTALPKTQGDKIEGQQGFKEEKDKPSEEIITKEETMFKIGPDGKALPEKYPIYIYDNNLESELIEESVILMESIKKQDAITKVLQEFKAKQTKEIGNLKNKVEKETDEKVKKKLQMQLVTMQNTQGMEEIKEKINSEVISAGIAESREIIQKLKELKKEQTQKKFIEVIPCSSSEAYLSFEKGKTIDNKETYDWVADLISKKCFNPQYTFEEAKGLRPDFKVAIKKAIMEVSDYKTENYRDVMLRKRMEEKRPLTLKKEKPIGEITSPAESAS